MKNVYLIHGWGGDSEGGWFDWLKEELPKKGFNVKAFDMPETNHPKIESWVGHLEKEIPLDDISEQTFFVGHSIGCQTIMRFLEKLPKHKRVGGCIFVAGWFDLIDLEPEEMEIAHPWINQEINFGRVLEHCNNFLALFSNNDPYVHSDEAGKFKKNLGANIIIKKGEEHFNTIQEIPEILRFIK